jgi:hypothetical protein
VADHHRVLDERLRELAANLDTGAAPEVAPAVLARLRTEPTPLAVRARRRVTAVIAAVLAAILVAGLASVPAVRAAVGDLFRLPGIVFDRGAPTPPRPTVTPGPGRLGEALQLDGPVSLAEALRLAPERVLVPSRPGLGEPDEVYVAGQGDRQVVHLLWRARPGLPALPGTAAGLYVTVFGDEAGMLLQKATRGAELEQVTVDSHPGLWIAREHGTIRFGPDGVPDFASERLSAPTLLVDRGTSGVRIESRLAKADVLTLAESLP